MASASSVGKLYDSVIDDVIANSREIITDEGGDEQVLAELKQIWKKKLAETNAVKSEAELAQSKPVSQPHQQVQQITTNLGTNLGTALGTNLGGATHHVPITPGDVVHALLQYTQQGTTDGQKTLTPKVTLTVPAHLAQTGLHTYVTTAPPSAATAVQLQPHFFQGNAIASTQHNSLHGQQLHYLSLNSEQVKSAQQVTAAPPQPGVIGQQYDGADDSSDEDENVDFSDNGDENDDNDDHQNDEDGSTKDEAALNSDDDLSDEGTNEQFDVDNDNVVVCQYDKITRSKNRWKFHLKDGIMHLKGKDFVFHKALGDSEW